LSHYFTKNTDTDSVEKDIYFKIREKAFHFITDNGVFSKSGLDFGSRLLLETVIDTPADRVLDLGTGYGPIGIVYKTFNPQAELTMSDVNERALALAKKNVKLFRINANIVASEGYHNLDGQFSLIISNPPVRAGKDLLQALLRDSFDHLEVGGKLIFVIHKQLGGESAKRFCEGIYQSVDVINKKAGYMIVQCIK